MLKRCRDEITLKRLRQIIKRNIKKISLICSKCSKGTEKRYFNKQQNIANEAITMYRE